MSATVKGVGFVTVDLALLLAIQPVLGAWMAAYDQVSGREALSRALRFACALGVLLLVVWLPGEGVRAMVAGGGGRTVVTRLLVETAWLLGVFGISFLAYWRMGLPISPRQFQQARERYGWAEPWIESGWLVGAMPLAALALALILT